MGLVTSLGTPVALTEGQRLGHRPTIWRFCEKFSFFGKGGLSERAAVKKLATDPKKRQLFPYRMHGYRFSTGETPQKREAAL